MKRFMLEGGILGSLLLIIFFLYHLGILPLLTVGGIGLFLLPLADCYMLQGRTVEKDFYQVTSYMEQMPASFGRTPIIRNALRDSQSDFPSESDMWKTLEKMSVTLETGDCGTEDECWTRGDLLRNAFSIMEKQYPCRRMALLHDFMVKAEETGGNTEEFLELWLQDFHMWKRRVLLFQKKRQHLCFESMIACVMTLGLCGLSVYFIPWNLRETLTESGYYQWSSAVMIIAMMAVFVRTLSKRAASWLDVEGEQEKKGRERLLKNYRVIKRHRDGCLCFFSKKICRQAVEREFPYWLLTVAMLLQMDNIFQAVHTAAEYTSEIIRREADEFLQRLYQDPVSKEPYRSFFSELEIPEVQSGMKMLYSIIHNGCENTSRQIRFLVEQNNLVVNQAEKRDLENRMAPLRYMRQLPIVIASLKIMFDILVLLERLVAG